VDRSEPYINWNSGLYTSILDFSAAHEDITTLLYSSYATFNQLLDNPQGHGFDQKDVKKQGGCIWVDHLHPTSQVHDWIAKHIAEFLVSVPKDRIG
jgi:phospholipase/lecithinase/hemolysin